MNFRLNASMADFANLVTNNRYEGTCSFTCNIGYELTGSVSCE